MQTVEMAKAPTEKYKDTKEYQEILERHKRLVDKGEIALLELKPVTKLTFGGFHVIGKIKDKYGNLVLDTENREDRIGIAPVGATLRFDKEEDLKFIYAIYNCDVLRSKCVIEGTAEPNKNHHRYILCDKEKSSLEYAESRELNIQYMNKFYNLGEDTIDFLCHSVSIPTNSSIGVKRAQLCQVWESDADKKTKLKGLMDSPDIQYYQAAYLALEEGKKTPGVGFYKTQNGVYKHNEQIIGNSLENLVSYLKSNDEVFIAISKGAQISKEAEKKEKAKK